MPTEDLFGAYHFLLEADVARVRLVGRGYAAEHARQIAIVQDL